METDPIERFGVGLSAAAVEARAAALGFQAVDGELDNTAKAAARLDLIMEQTSRTSGDFANTAGDLANAQKIAAAQFENAKASLGESLLPVFQTLSGYFPRCYRIVGTVGAVAEAFAISLGNVLEHREGALDLLDILQGFSDLPRAFGALGTILTAPFIGLSEASQQFTEQINTQGLIDDLRGGADAATALANRLAQVGREGKLSPQFIRDLTRIAGTDLRRTADVLREVAQRGAELGLSADEIRNVAVALAQINSVGESSEAERIAGRIEEVGIAADSALTPLQEVRVAAEEAGVGFADLASATDPAVQAMVNALDPADRAAVLLGTIGGAAQTAAGIFGDVFQPALADASQALEDLNDDGTVTANEFIANLQRMTAAQLRFATDLATIFALDPDVAAQLATLPLEQAAEIVSQAAGDPDQVRQLVEAFFGTSQQQEDAILSIFNDTFTALIGGDPQLQAQAATVPRRPIQRRAGLATAVAGSDERCDTARPVRFVC